MAPVHRRSLTSATAGVSSVDADALADPPCAIVELAEQRGFSWVTGHSAPRSRSTTSDAADGIPSSSRRSFHRPSSAWKQVSPTSRRRPARNRAAAHRAAHADARRLGSGDVFFDVRWAHWLEETIPGVERVVEIPNVKLFYPTSAPATSSRPARAEHGRVGDRPGRAPPGGAGGRLDGRRAPGLRVRQCPRRGRSGAARRPALRGDGLKGSRVTTRSAVASGVT
jgi:hypothetical protein